MNGIYEAAEFECKSLLTDTKEQECSVVEEKKMTLKEAESIITNILKLL